MPADISSGIWFVVITVGAILGSAWASRRAGANRISVETREDNSSTINALRVRIELLEGEVLGYEKENRRLTERVLVLEEAIVARAIEI